jgi:hypothetical protein
MIFEYKLCSYIYRSETDYYETSSNVLKTNLQSCIHYKRVSYSEMRMRPPASARRPMTDLKSPRVYVDRFL